jgi:hypothetical protein
MTRYYSASKGLKSGAMMSESKGKGPSRLSGVIQQEKNALSDIHRETARLETVTQQLATTLPARMQGHWQVASISAEALSVSVTGSVWATPLRAQQQALLAKAKQIIGVEPAKLRIRVQSARAERPRRGGPRMSSQAGATLREAARGIEDPKLAAALARLAERDHKKPD